MKDFFTRYRGWIVFLFVVPFSFMYRTIQNAGLWMRRILLPSAKAHDRKVREIQHMVRKAYAEGRTMCTARAPWKAMSMRTVTYKKEMACIPIGLRNILMLDKETMTLRVEPMVTMADVTRYLNPKGYALAVQVEMDDLTVGGLCMGIGIETSSHRYGFLYETIKAYEIVTADGKLLRVTKDDHPELFRTLPMSHGTLGFLVAVELEVVPIKKYMRLHYKPCSSRARLGEVLQKLTLGKHLPSYLEALAFPEGKAVVMVGELVDKPGNDGRVNPVNRWYKPWFYTHVETFLEKGPAVEYIPVRHYFHRHTPSMFFQLKDLIPFGNKAWYRYLFAWMGAPKVALMKYSMTKELRKRSLYNRVAQDILIPMQKVEEGLEFIDQNYAIYPLWICPVKITHQGKGEGLIRNPETLVAGKDYQMYVDLGIYGIPPSVKEGTWDAVATSRKLEKMVRKNGGFSMLYADIFMTRDEFEEMFNHELYRAVRRRYNATDAFPEVYDKVIPERWLIDLEDRAGKLDSRPVKESIEI